MEKAAAQTRWASGDLRPKGDAQPVVMFRDKLVLIIRKVSQFSVNRYTVLGFEFEIKLTPAQLKLIIWLLSHYFRNKVMHEMSRV